MPGEEAGSEACALFRWRSVHAKYFIPVWSDDSAFPSCTGHSTSLSVVKSALRAFSEAIMQTFCQSLICCLRSVCTVANAKNLFAVAGPTGGVCSIIGEFTLEKKCPLPRQCRRSPPSSRVGVTNVYTFLRWWTTEGERRDPSVVHEPTKKVFTFWPRLYYFPPYLTC